jgi:hypothetical protein
MSPTSRHAALCVVNESYGTLYRVRSYQQTHLKISKAIERKVAGTVTPHAMIQGPAGFSTDDVPRMTSARYAGKQQSQSHHVKHL